jgi:hypothetical protein
MGLRDAALPSDLTLPNTNVEPVARFENPSPEKRVPAQPVDATPSEITPFSKGGVYDARETGEAWRWPNTRASRWPRM